MEIIGQYRFPLSVSIWVNRNNVESSAMHKNPPRSFVKWYLLPVSCMLLSLALYIISNVLFAGMKWVKWRGLKLFSYMMLHSMWRLWVGNELEAQYFSNIVSGRWLESLTPVCQLPSTWKGWWIFPHFLRLYSILSILLLSCLVPSSFSHFSLHFFFYSSFLVQGEALCWKEHILWAYDTSAHKWSNMNSSPLKKPTSICILSGVCSRSTGASWINISVVSPS